MAGGKGGCAEQQTFARCGAEKNTAKANDFPLAERQRAANKAARQGGVFNNNISCSIRNDNTEFAR